MQTDEKGDPRYSIKIEFKQTLQDRLSNNSLLALLQSWKINLSFAVSPSWKLTWQASLIQIPMIFLKIFLKSPRRNPAYAVFS